MVSGEHGLRRADGPPFRTSAPTLRSCNPKLQYHFLKAVRDYGQYVRDARNAGQDDIASFLEQVMQQDSDRAQQCHGFLARLGGADNTSPQSEA